MFWVKYQFASRVVDWGGIRVSEVAHIGGLDGQTTRLGVLPGGILGDAEDVVVLRNHCPAETGSVYILDNRANPVIAVDLPGRGLRVPSLDLPGQGPIEKITPTVKADVAETVNHSLSTFGLQDLTRIVRRSSPTADRAMPVAWRGVHTLSHGKGSLHVPNRAIRDELTNPPNDRYLEVERPPALFIKSPSGTFLYEPGPLSGPEPSTPTGLYRISAAHVDRWTSRNGPNTVKTPSGDFTVQTSNPTVATIIDNLWRTIAKSFMTEY